MLLNGLQRRHSQYHAVNGREIVIQDDIAVSEGNGGEISMTKADAECADEENSK